MISAGTQKTNNSTGLDNGVEIYNTFFIKVLVPTLAIYSELLYTNAKYNKNML